MTILLYLIKTTFSLFLFYLLFIYVFKKEGRLKFNRYFLLFSLIASFLIPFMKHNLNFSPQIVNNIQPAKYIAPLANNFIEMPNNTTNNHFVEEQTSFSNKTYPLTKTETQKTNAINYMQIGTWSLLGLYLLGLIVLFFCFLYQVLQTFQLFRHNYVENIPNAKLIQHNLDIMPFSIFNYIIINTNHYSEKELEYVLLHEKEHIVQMHSFDILLIELLKIIFWINPIIWLYEKEMKQNHEFLADRAVIDHGAHIYEYQLILLNSSLGVPKFKIVNNFNQSYIKKRITMMTSKKINKLPMWKLLLMIPVLFAIIIACAKQSVSKTTSDVPIATNSPVATEEISDFTKYIELNTPYDWVSYQGARLFCKGTYLITKINTDGSFEGFQDNHTYHAHFPVTGKLTKNQFEIYTNGKMGEIWTISSSENGKLCGEIFADYALARSNKLTFYLAKKIAYNELLPASLNQPGDEISKNLHLKLNEKYFYETFNDNGELGMTGLFIITNYDKITKEISGRQWNYRGNAEGVFSGSLYDDSLTINIGKPWNEVWKAKLEGGLLKGTLEMNPTAAGFENKKTIHPWVMSNTSHPILTADKVAKLKIPYNIARYSGMEENLNALLSENMKYPEQALMDKIEGKVYVSFTVNADGSISNVKVARKVNPLLDEEALRLIKLTDKKWVPALVNDLPVDSESLMPIVFKL